MATYKYRAKKGPTDIIEGTIDAQSETEAVEKISQLGFTPIQIEKQVLGFEPQGPGLNKSLFRVRVREITVFSRQLASLLKSGVPILNSLNIISEQSENPNFKLMLRDIHNAVKNGSTFSSTLSGYPNVFPPLYIAMIRIGEDTGKLSDVLLRIADYRQKEEEMFSRFRMALAYPMFMAFVGIATVVFMLTFVMPRLTGLFVNMGQELPLPTQILISVSNALRFSWFWIVLVLAIAIMIIKRELKTKTGKITFGALQLRLPLFGKFVLKAELARFARTLELLIRNGIPILRAIDIAVPVLDNEIIKKQLRQSYKELEQGGSFGRSLKSSKIFPLFMSNLISVGEASGEIDDALGEVASAYERDTDEAIRVMSSLLEPVMILGMGLIVGFIVVAMLLPVFQINIMMR
jgi:type II secretory pathway component PulF